MNHTSSIALAFVIAFMIFVVSRGELPVYMGILGIGGHDVSAQCNSGGGLISSVVGAVSSATQPLPSTGPV